MIGIYLLLTLCVCIWGWTFVATKICLPYLKPFELVGLRFAIGMPILFALVFVKKVPFGFTRTDSKAIVFGAAVIIAHFLIQVVGLQYTTATNTGWIISITPLVTVVLAYFFLHEQIGRNEILGVIIATLGVFFLVSRGDFSSFSWLRSVGDWLVLASAHTWAIYTVATRNLSRKHEPLAVTLVIFTPLLLTCLIPMLFISDWASFIHLPTGVTIALIFLGVFGTLAQWFWQIGIAKLGTAKAGYFLYLEPVATTVLAVPLIREYFGWPTAIGALLVLSGLFVAQRVRKGS